MVKVPICGSSFVSLTMAIFVASSTSVSPNSLSPIPAGIDGIVGRCDHAPRQNGVELYAWNGAPIEFERGPGGIDLGRRSVHRAEDVKLVALEVDRDWIVDLKRRTLRAKGPSGGRYQCQERRESGGR